MSTIDPAMPIRMLPDLRSPGAGMSLNDSVYDRLLRERAFTAATVIRVTRITNR